jgi:uncharacterized membrane protein
MIEAMIGVAVLSIILLCIAIVVYSLYVISPFVLVGAIVWFVGLTFIIDRKCD